MGSLDIGMNGALLGAVAPWVSAFFGPLWIIGTGALLGLLGLLAIWGISFVLSRSYAAAAAEVAWEAPLRAILATASIMSLMGLVGFALVKDPGDILASLSRIRAVGTQTYEVKVPLVADAETIATTWKLPQPLFGDELRELEITSNEPLLVEAVDDGFGKFTWRKEVESGLPFLWSPRRDVSNPFRGEKVESLVVTNQGQSEAQIRLTVHTGLKYHEVMAIPITAVGLVLIVLAYFLLRVLAPKVSAIALATTKSEMSQPLFALLMVATAFLLWLFLYIPYHTFNEDIKMLKDSGLTLIMIVCIFQAIWAGSTSVADEIEGRTAMTVLSKPIGRRQFVLGKFLGIAWLVVVMFIILGTFFLGVVSYKVLYDSREMTYKPMEESSAGSVGMQEPTWRDCHAEAVMTVPGLVLAFMEAIVLTSISVAISTRLPLLANLVIVFAIYAAGHLTPLLVQSGAGQLETVDFIAQLIAVIFPVLDHFNIQTAVASRIPVPLPYLGWALVYCLTYTTTVLLLALALFQDRDLA